ncbi:MAG: hypothetical protein Q8R15_02615 [Candidatus Micrarchaeota archaeon]|nr:hypothetical protein [Candidatus Micrarchaeota archaeon]
MEKSKLFYSAALKSLGYRLLKEKPASAGFGIEDVDGKRDFWIKAGGIDNGSPGYRTKYYPGYYAAYVLDPDGYNIEAVFDDPNPLK